MTLRWDDDDATRRGCSRDEAEPYVAARDLVREGKYSA
jgi:hypothetical protein